MADESTAVVSQPSAAGEEQSQGAPHSDYSAFLGPPSAEADLSEEQRPAPGQEGEAEGEPELSGEGEPDQPEQQPGEQPQEAPAEEEGEEPEQEESEQSPSVEERLKDLTQREAD